MKVLLVGGGGREHALARSIAGSPLLDRMIAVPGNPGIEELADCVPLSPLAVQAIAELAVREQVHLVVIGPEAPLAAGLADEIRKHGIPCFGAGKDAARMESSKAFAKAFMDRHGIPTAAWKSFTDAAAARAWAREFARPLVVKASGLAAGKGVIVPESDEELDAAIMQLLALGDEDGSIVLEERLEGQELSLIAVCDGTRYALLPPARDHKRLLDGDHGPNTGGMGTIAPVCSRELAEEYARQVIAPVLRGLAEEGTPFVGALYAGLMLTKDGPRVLEYNARFGDPETQVMLPLLDGDLLAALYAAARGRFAPSMLRWQERHAACVVLAAYGYPEHPRKGDPITIGELPEGAWMLHAGTARKDGHLVTAGGRVLCAVGVDDTLAAARAKAYAAAFRVHFDGMHFRSDIGSGLQHPKPASSYAAAGVDIDAGNKAVAMMKAAVVSTYGPEVLAGIGAFGGQYDASKLKSLRKPVLVASTDGVGTKTSLGLSLGRVRQLGHDIVNHSFNDILVQGARPLFFMDYIAADRLDPARVAEIVAGMAEACKAGGCALLGGETAEMPGTYRTAEMDIAGTIVGVVEEERRLPRSNLQAGDVLVGLASSGLHTNGYSLARRIVADKKLDRQYPGLEGTLADALLAPHRSYLPLLDAALKADPPPVKALAHITGGGFLENIPRVLPESLDAHIRLGSWPVPALFRLLQEWGQVDAEEMYRVFNMGIGMVAIVAEHDVERFLRLVPEPAHVIGALEPGTGKVRLA